MRYNRHIVIIGNILIACFIASAVLADAGAGSRASYTRGGWAGAKYVAIGKAGEVAANDVFAIYWNPAGLSELKGKKTLTLKEIKDKAQKGKVSDIKENDLTRFSDDSPEESVFQIGFSGAMLDVDRNAGFAGCAFDMFNGVMGIGLYSIASTGIEGRDEQGNSTGKLDYAGAVSYLSYGWSKGASSLGFSVKCLYEKIDNVTYMGGGLDIGAQVYALPFLKLGFVIQDIGTGLTPIESYENIDKRYDYSYPTIRFGAALDTGATGATFIFSIHKKLEQDNFNYSFGVQYELLSFTTVYIGLNNSSFSAGITINIKKIDISYAFIIDNIDYGYNNIVSLSFLF